MATPGFLFGGNTGVSYEQLQRRREAADLLARQILGRQPKNTAEGIGAMLQGLAVGIGRYRNDKAFDDQAAKASSLRDELFGTITGTSPASPAAANTALGMPEAASEMAATNPAPSSLNQNEIYSGFIDTVKTGGLDNPYGLAAVAATGKAESGWSPENANRTWSDPSESGQPGTAGGIMSWRGPRLKAMQAFARKAGEDPSNISPQTQAKFFLSENPSLVQALDNAKSVDEAQKLMNNAWAFAGYNRPGGESARRLGLANAYLPTLQGSQAAPQTQVASLDPNSAATASDAIDAIAPQQPQGMPSAASPMAPPAFDPGRWGEPIKLAEMPPSQDDLPMALAAQRQAAAQGAGMPQQNPLPMQQPAPPATPLQQAALSPLPSREVGPAPQVAGVPPQQVAQNGPSMPAAPQGVNIDPRWFQIINNPFLDEGSRNSARMVVQQLMQQQEQAREEQLWRQRQQYEQQQRVSDPAYQIGLKKAGLELEAAESGKWDRLDDGRLYNQRTGEIKSLPGGETSGESFFGNPMPFKRPDGSIGYGQLGNKGTFREVKVGEGNQFAPPTKTVNTETEQIIIDNFGNILDRIPINNREAAADTAYGTAEGKAGAEAKTNLPKVESQSQQILSTLDRLENHPGFSASVGWQGNIPDWAVPAGTKMADFMSLLDQTRGQSFLQAFESLKGAGQITEMEGKKATDAINRLSRNLTEDEFKQAIGELREIVGNGMRSAQQKAGRNSSAPVQPQSPAGDEWQEISPGVRVRKVN